MKQRPVSVAWQRSLIDRELAELSKSSDVEADLERLKRELSPPRELTSGSSDS